MAKTVLRTLLVLSVVGQTLGWVILPSYPSQADALILGGAALTLVTVTLMFLQLLRSGNEEDELEKSRKYQEL